MEQDHTLEDDRHKGKSLQITVSIAEYMEQELEEDNTLLVLCQSSKFSCMELESALTAVLFQLVSLLHIPCFKPLHSKIVCLCRHFIHPLRISVARLTALFVLSAIHCHIRLGVKYVHVFSYSYVYFDTRELPACQTLYSGSVLSITTVDEALRLYVNMVWCNVYCKAERNLTRI